MKLYFCALTLVTGHFFTLAAWGQTPNILPLAPANQWVLQSPYMPSPVTLQVVSDQMMGPKRRVQVHFTNPWTNFDFLFNPVVGGTMLEGIVQNGITSHFEDPVAWFSVTAQVGDSWPTPMGQVTLLSKTAAVVTPSGTYQNCWKYQVGTASAAQFWYLAPAVGFVQYGDGPAAFVLVNSTLNAAPAPAPPGVAGPCPKIGIDPNPAANTTFSNAVQDSTLAATVAGGSRYLNVDATWAQLEPSPRTYYTSGVKAWMDRAQTNNLDVSFTLRSVDSTVISLPSDLQGKALNDPAVISRFQALLAALAPVLNSHVRWVSLGNEINLYYSTNPGQIGAFQQFYAAGASTLKALKPGISVGIVFSYPGYWYSNAFFTPFLGLPDFVAFTYYPIRADFTMRPSSVAGSDIAEMIAAANGKPVILTELGYSGASPSSPGPAEQQAFYSNSFDALQKSSGKIAAASFFMLSDLPTATVAQLSSYYGQLSANFASYLGSLGVQDQIGAAKPSYTTWKTRAQSFTGFNACTTQ